MTLEEPPAQQPSAPPRLTLMPIDQSVGEIGGAWWPRSRELASELPALLAGLAERLGRVERVVYDPAGWARAPDRIVIGDAVVTLDAYRYESFNMLYAYGIDGESIVLRVVPAATDDVTAQALMSVGNPSGG